MTSIVRHAVVIVGLFVLACAPAQPAAAPAQPAPAAPAPAVKAAQPEAKPAPPAPVAKPAQPVAAAVFRPEPQLLEAAKKEGEVVWYASLAQRTAEEVKQRFEARTGVRVQLTRLSAGPQRDRVLRERQAGLRATDVMDHGNVAFWVDYKRQGILERYVPKEGERFRPEFRDKDGFFVAVFLSSQFISYNPKVVTAAEAPKRWADASDPKWRGKTSIGHPKHSGVANEFALAMVKLFGWQFFEKLKANQVLLVRSLAEAIPLLVSGERPVNFETWDQPAWEAKRRGSPIEFVFPEEGTMLSIINAGIVKDPPHPNAARLLLEYLTSQEHQQFLAEGYIYVPRADVRYPPDMRPLSELKVLTVDPEEVFRRQEEINEKFADLFGG